MSNHLAIATVTAALGQLVHRAAETAVGVGLSLNFGRPTPPPAEGGPRGIHVYLYQVTHSAALRNGDLPTRQSDGRLAGRPRAALDLHYLLSFVGDATKLEPDRMLGAAVRDLHARPVLSAQAIEDAINTYRAELDGSDLALALERVKFTPAPLSLDELTKLWSVFMQTPHQLSVAYQGTVVLIDAELGAASALPVLRRGQDDRGVNTRLGVSPQLDAVWFGSAAALAQRPRPPSLAAAQLGSSLAIAGGGLAGDAVALRFTHSRLPAIELSVPEADRDAHELVIALPDDATAQTQWAAGVYGVCAQLTRDASGALLRSNTLGFALAPRVVALAPNPAARAAAALLTVTCRPQVLPAQDARLLLGDREIASEPHPAATDTLRFALAGAPQLNGAPVRLRVDGVDSMPLVYDPNARRFVFDDAQRITIT